MASGGIQRRGGCQHDVRLRSRGSPFPDRSRSGAHLPWRVATLLRQARVRAVRARAVARRQLPPGRVRVARPRSSSSPVRRPPPRPLFLPQGFLRSANLRDI